MNHYILNLSFYGKDYLGWQSQKDFSPTIQGVLSNALEKIFKTSEILTLACGRTDSGVSANTLIVKISTPFFIEANSLLSAINTNLPCEIRAMALEETTSEFHPIALAKSRTYKYLFTNKQNVNPFESLLMPNVKYELDWNKLEMSAKLFEGEHDFKDFMCVGSDVKSTIRTIYSIKIEKNIKANMQGLISEYNCITITGNGFLKQMVRLMVGCMWNVARDKISLNELELSLKTPQGLRLGAVAPALGLYKISTQY